MEVNLLLATMATMLRNFEVAFLSVCWNIKLTLRIRKSRLEATSDSLASVSSFPLPLFLFAHSICKISKWIINSANLNSNCGPLKGAAGLCRQ